MKRFYMSKTWFKLFIIGVLFSIPIGAHADYTPVTLNANDRILVLAPHPDDEVLGAGGIIQQAKAMGIPVKIVFFTYGDSNQWSFLLYRKHLVLMPGAVVKMGLVRHDEALAASQILGLSSTDLIFLGYPDFGTMTIWQWHWGVNRPPLRSLLTRVTEVPYQGAYREGSPYKGESIISDLRQIIGNYKPTKVFVSHPADHNGDHLSLYLFTRVALWDEQLPDVKIYPYLIHYLGWPYTKKDQLSPYLNPPQRLMNNIDWMEYRLTDAQLAKKKLALQAHKTQYASSPKYLKSFLKMNELFGDFPTISLKDSKDKSVFVVQHQSLKSAELPDELNDREKASFIGVEWKFIQMQDKDLVVSIQLSKPLAQNVEASIYIFGYRPDVPFERMPKIRIRLGDLSYNVYDQVTKLSQQSVSIHRDPSAVTIHVPMVNLGNPTKVLTSARTYLGNVPLDTSSWVAVELE